MFRSIATVGCLTAGLLLSQGTIAVAQQGDGPVRKGVRRTGQAVAEGTRAAARATGEAARKTGQAVAEGTRKAARATEEVARRTGEAARNAAQGTAEAARRLTGREDNARMNSQSGAQSGATAQAQTEGRQPYQAGYRGVEQGQTQMHSQVVYNGRVRTLRHDSHGRQFICVCGCPVYLDNSQMSHDHSKAASGGQAPPAPEPHRADRPTSDGQPIDTQESGAASSSRQKSGPTLSENSHDTAASGSSESPQN